MPLPVGRTGAGGGGGGAGAGGSVAGGAVEGAAVAAVVLGSVGAGAPVVGAAVVGAAVVVGAAPSVVDVALEVFGTAVAAATENIGHGVRVRGGTIRARRTVTRTAAETRKRKRSCRERGIAFVTRTPTQNAARAERIAEVQMDPTSSAGVGRR
jgi:hypothetical protein